jgi:hypothetical protein
MVKVQRQCKALIKRRHGHETTCRGSEVANRTCRKCGQVFPPEPVGVPVSRQLVGHEGWCNGILVEPVEGGAAKAKAKGKAAAKAEAVGKAKAKAKAKAGAKGRAKAKAKAGALAKARAKAKTKAAAKAKAKMKAKAKAVAG